MKGFFYLATVYSRHPEGTRRAFEEAAAYAAAFLRKGIPVVSPIAHSHPIAVHGGIDPLDHPFWMAADEPIMDAAVGMIVVKMPGWKESAGIAAEIVAFKAAGKPVLYFDPPA